MVETLSIKVTPEEVKEIDRAWRSREDIKNRSQFIKNAIKYYMAFKD